MESAPLLKSPCNQACPTAVSPCQGVGPLWASRFTWEARARDPLLSGPPISLEVLSPTQGKRWMPCPFHTALTLNMGRVFTSSPLACWEGRISPVVQDPSSRTKNQIDMRQVNRRNQISFQTCRKSTETRQPCGVRLILSLGERQGLGVQRGGRPLAGS